ncbi:CYTH domain-containing protein [archaeon]|jgi:predicted adenylyl cyclase CyaB|nr:CYTH domain-containing protein [archaeon]MBT3451215.1 CYTH domain-containing protein [archaeon]MBT6869781.1 CYTH domain-containing protein [archaeon]MBT7192736.1 CYTH domain-containing protein [archaeon]MBT7380761.1 CYTH domain-containing protein [archaeon]
MNIEVEIRSFISKEKYEQLIEFFTKKGKFVNEDYQETFYFDCEQDLRIQKNKFYSKVWLKKGKLHDDHREELEIKCDVEDFEILEKIFTSMGYDIEIKWFRNRHTFEWQGVSIMLDYSKGYGHIIELEKMSDESNKEKVLFELKEKLNSLNIIETSKEEFKQKYEHYKLNWKSLV